MEQWSAPPSMTMPGALVPEKLRHSLPACASCNSTSFAAGSRVALRTIAESVRCRGSRYRRPCWGRSCAADMDCLHDRQRRIAELESPQVEIGHAAPEHPE